MYVFLELLSQALQALEKWSSLVSAFFFFLNEKKYFYHEK